MLLNVSKMLQRIDDLRAAAAAARALAKHFNGQERRGILELADDLDSRASDEKNNLEKLSDESERL
jgi:hypothetical protein